jgi:hypothetical protein
MIAKLEVLVAITAPVVPLADIPFDMPDVLLVSTAVYLC